MSNGASERNWGVIVGAIGVFLLAFAFISWLWMPFLPWAEERQAGEEIIKDTYDAEAARENYEWFRTQWHDIQAQRAQVENAYDAEATFHETYGTDPSAWSRTAETRHGRLHERITGNQNMLEQMVADYNARSDMAHRALFKCNLPYQVDDRFAIRGPPGSGPAEQPQDTYVDGADPSEEPPKPAECDALPAEADT